MCERECVRESVRERERDRECVRQSMRERERKPTDLDKKHCGHKSLI